MSMLERAFTPPNSTETSRAGSVNVLCACSACRGLYPPGLRMASREGADLERGSRVSQAAAGQLDSSRLGTLDWNLPGARLGPSGEWTSWGGFCSLDDICPGRQLSMCFRRGITVTSFPPSGGDLTDIDTAWRI
jgi:hypothetical protein